MPIVFAFVLGLAFVLLAAHVSLDRIPIKSILLNLLSVGASYGILVLVVQHHWAEGVLGFTARTAASRRGTAVSVRLLFGLSMDTTSSFSAVSASTSLPAMRPRLPCHAQFAARPAR